MVRKLVKYDEDMDKIVVVEFADATDEEVAYAALAGYRVGHTGTNTSWYQYGVIHPSGHPLASRYASEREAWAAACWWLLGGGENDQPGERTLDKLKVDG